MTYKELKNDYFNRNGCESVTGNVV